MEFPTETDGSMFQIGENVFHHRKNYWREHFFLLMKHRFHSSLRKSCIFANKTHERNENK